MVSKSSLRHLKLHKEFHLCQRFLTLKKELVDILLLEQHKYKCLSDFTPTKLGESHTNALELISTLDSSHWIYKILEENFSEDPLKL
jgi:hypothetical protein